MAWKPGQSGNPAGRRGDANITRARRAIARELPSIVASLVEQARAGDVQAAKLLLERAIPAMRPIDTELMNILEQRIAQLEDKIP